MKKSILNILGIVVLFALIIISPVKVEAKGLDITLSCPTQANPKKNITCSIYANISGGNTATISRIEVIAESPFISKEVTLKKGDTIKNGEVGQITLKSKESGGTGRVMIDIDASFKLGGVINDDDQSYITVLSAVNTLNSIKIDGELVPDYNKNQTTYNITTNKEKVNISNTKTSSKSKATATNTKLKCGNNTIKITVSAENKDKKVYTLNIKRNCSNNAYLKGITLSKGTLSPEFDKNTYEYTVELDKTVDKLTIKGIKDEEKQTISGEIENKKIDFGTTKVSLIVTSDNNEKKTYVININKKDTRSSNNLLSAISLSDGNITFDPNTLDYQTKVLYDTEKIEVVAIPEDKQAKVEIKGGKNLKVGENLITITVTSEKQEKKQYKITVTRLKQGETLGNNANIKNIIVKNYKLPFEYTKTDYKLVIKDEDKLDINVIMDDTTSTYSIIGNENLKDGSIIKIITKSQDNTTRTYTINITKASVGIIYYVIAIVLVLLVIGIPLVVYLKSVKKKKENLDVNGYKLDDNKSINQERTIISTKNNINTNKESISNNMNNINNANINKENISNNVNNTNTNNENINNEDFDAGLQDYMPNESTNKCPACGRELLGTPNECPYCKTQIR